MSADTNTPESKSEIIVTPNAPLLNFIFQEPKRGQYALDMTAWDIIKDFQSKSSSLGSHPAGISLFKAMCNAQVRDHFNGMPRVRQLIEKDDNFYFDFGIDPFVLADFRNEYGYTCSA